MVTAYILILTESNKEQAVLNELQELDEVKKADILYGEYDIIAEIELESLEQLSGFVLNNLRKIKGIKQTSTLIATS